MPTITQDEERNNEDRVRIVAQSTAYTQPWYHRIKDGVVSSFGESNCVGGDTDSSTAPQSGICSCGSGRPLMLLLGAIYYQLHNFDLCTARNEEALLIDQKFAECFGNMANAWKE